MSSFLCFICHSKVDSRTNEETREKYCDIIGIKLSPGSNLCFICCHVLNKLSLFRSICLRKSLQYPVLFSGKGAMDLQKSDLEVTTLCSGNCIQTDKNTYNYIYNDNKIEDYLKLDDENDYQGYFQNQTKFNDSLDMEKIVNLNTELTKDIHNEVLNTEIDENNDGIFNDNNNSEVTEDIVNESRVDNFNSDIKQETKKRKVKKSDRVKKKLFKKAILSLDEQKAELEGKRRDKKYTEAEFKCYNCALGFLFKDSYQTHMMRHEESNGEYQCPTCTLRFATATLLRAHTTSHAERYYCSRCGDSLKPRSKRTHACAKKISVQSVACQICGNLFRDANGLQQHLKRVHASKTGGRLLSCVVCGETYNSQAALRTHMIKHIKRKFPCDQCSSTYSSPYTLTQHKRTHTSSDLHHCNICDATYKTRKSLVAHRRNTINHQMALFECPICTRTCPTQRSLASHIQTVHSTTKDFACNLCSKTYTSRKSLIRHINSHSRKAEVKVAVCHLCGSSFKGNNKLNRHLREVCEKEKIEDISTMYE